METSVNNKCRAFTSLEQSKKLAEILPLESADMYFIGHQSIINPKEWEYEDMPKVRGSYIAFDDKRIFYPCWSLAALLSVLPTMIGNVFEKDALRLRIDKSETDFNIWYSNLDTDMVEEGFDVIKTNPVDACVEMIIRLNELKML